MAFRKKFRVFLLPLLRLRGKHGVRVPYTMARTCRPGLRTGMLQSVFPADTIIQLATAGLLTYPCHATPSRRPGAGQWHCVADISVSDRRVRPCHGESQQRVLSGIRTPFPIARRRDTSVPGRPLRPQSYIIFSTPAIVFVEFGAVSRRTIGGIRPAQGCVR